MPAGPPALIRATNVVSDGLYNSFPWPALRSNGEIVAVFREGTDHYLARGGNITMMVSTDGGNGNSWSAKSYIATADLLDPFKCDYRDPSVVKISTGRWFVNSYNFDIPANHSNALYLFHSDDEGATWSAPTTITTGFAGAGTGNQSSAAIMEHSSGKLFFPIYEQHASSANNRAGVLLSTDHGATWPTLVQIGPSNIGFSETSFVELPNGDVLAFVRNDDVGDVWISRSTDIGLSWSALVAQGWSTIGCRPAALIEGGTNTIICWYRSSPNAYPAWRYSLDLGVSWSAEQIYHSGNVSEYSGGIYQPAVGHADLNFLASYDVGGAGTQADIDWVRISGSKPY